jgi:hypothetical protein
MWRPVAVIVALLLGVAVLSDIAWRERRLAKEIEQLTTAGYVDMGIRLVVVERDDDNGTRLVPGNSQKMREVARHDRGGIVKLYTGPDGHPTAHIVRKSNNPIVWYASRDQADLILHDGPRQWALVQGSEGSGKTTVLAMWVAFRVLEHIGHQRTIGLTAPTMPRLKIVLREVLRWWPPRWFRMSARDMRLIVHAGPDVQLVSAVQRSAEGGSPFQGLNLVAHAGDEWQDHFQLEEDSQARGRSAPDVIRDGALCEAWYPRLFTSTFKDSSAWRTFKAACVANDNAEDPSQRFWHVTKLLGLDSPFVSPKHWEKLRTGGTMTPREYRRRVLAEEVGPEAQLYHCWSRKAADGSLGNLRPLPSPSSSVQYEDVTAEVLKDYGSNIQVLVGHDPGKRQHVSVYLKAFRFAPDVRKGDMRPRWYIIGETTSPDSTLEVHIQEVLKRLRAQWSCNEPARVVNGKPILDPHARKALVRIDPHDTRGEKHPSRDFYTIWRSFGLLAKAAFYVEDKPSQIKVETRINLVNTLLCAQTAEGETRRMFVACDENGKPLTHNPGEPERVVDAFESMERNEAGKAEWENKDRHDKSHWIAAVAYAVFQLERRNVHLYAAWGAV